MAFNLSENTAREIQSAFEAFQESETLVARQFVQDLHDVHIKAAMAYSFLRAEAEQAGVSLSSPSLWKSTSFAGKAYKDYRAFMAIVADHQEEIIQMVNDRQLTSWQSTLRIWKKENRKPKETVEETWEDALFKLMDKFNVSATEIAEYLLEMEEKGSTSAALDVAPLTVIDPAKMKTKTKAKTKAA